MNEGMKLARSIIRLMLLLAVLLCFCSRTFADSTESSEQDDFFALSLEELMEVPTVVSASRQQQKITVITAEDNLTLSMNDRYTDDQRNAYKVHVPETHRFYLTIAKDVCDGKGEFTIGVSDLFNRTNDAVASQAVAGNETPGRMYFARFQMKS